MKSRTYTFTWTITWGTCAEIVRRLARADQTRRDGRPVLQILFCILQDIVLDGTGVPSYKPYPEDCIKQCCFGYYESGGRKA
jgi:hypothetical protein